MVLDELNTRRIAIVVAGLLIWVLHAFTRLALFPLSLMEDAFYYWGIYILMTVLTGICAFYLMVIVRECKLWHALWIALTWLFVYAIVEYGRHLYLTREYAYPVNNIAQSLVSVSYIPLAAFLGYLVIVIMRQRQK